MEFALLVLSCRGESKDVRLLAWKSHPSKAFNFFLLPVSRAFLISDSFILSREAIMDKTLSYSILEDNKARVHELLCIIPRPDRIELFQANLVPWRNVTLLVPISATGRI